MHEFSIVRSLLDVAVAEADRAGAKRVLRIDCRIGALRQIDDGLMSEAFNILRDGTICAEADLRIEKTYMRASCPRCERDFDVRGWNWCCPQCGMEGTLVGGGDELDIVAIEAETE
jgi:hydrogenase nickel incorporation protein HypA/HybF